MPLKPGSSAEVTATVGEADTAIALGSGEVPVLGTPRVLALMEEASLRVVEAQLGPGETTVGVMVQLEHVAPTAVGTSVTAKATLKEVTGRRITFTVAVRDDDHLIAAGRMTRVLVDRATFLAKLG